MPGKMRFMKASSAGDVERGGKGASRDADLEMGSGLSATGDMRISVVTRIVLSSSVFSL